MYQILPFLLFFGCNSDDSLKVLTSNRNPEISSLSIAGDLYNDQTLSCIGTYSDPDNDELTESFVWSNLTTEQELGTDRELTLTWQSASPGDIISCALTVTDSSEDASSTSISETLLNRPPSVVSATLSPEPAFSDSVIICAPSDSADPDGDQVIHEFAWMVNGVAANGSDSLLANAFQTGDVVTCTLTPNDGRDSGNEVSASILISSRGPVIQDISIVPINPNTNNVLTATANTIDVEGELSVGYEWFVDGNMIQSGTENTLDGAVFFDKNQQISIIATPTDDFGTGSPATASVICMNTIPEAPGIEINPTAPIEQVDDLMCSISSDSIDIDSDVVTYSFSWMVDGSIFSGSSDTATTSTVPSIETNAGESWMCTVTPNDGDGDGISSSVSVSINEYVPSGSQTFTATETIDSFTVPTGVYSITIQAWGAQGGATNGGKGASMSGEFAVTPGQVLSVVVGMTGETNSCGGFPASGGGGGGSFVWDPLDTTQPLIAAGGGGGGNLNWSGTCTNGMDGVTSMNGTAGSEGLAQGGSNGNGGDGNAPSGTGAGGAGWLGAGQNSIYDGSQGGQGLPTFAGGSGSSTFGPGGEGGFGGGGSSVCGCGGGGGYSGGAGGNGSSCRAGGGGGGSYNAGTNQSNSAGVQTGEGMVEISW